MKNTKAKPKKSAKAEVFEHTLSAWQRVRLKAACLIAGDALLQGDVKNLKKYSSESSKDYFSRYKYGLEGLENLRPSAFRNKKR